MRRNERHGSFSTSVQSMLAGVGGFILLLVAQAMINDRSLKNQEAVKIINSLIQTYSTKIN